MQFMQLVCNYTSIKLCVCVVGVAAYCHVCETDTSHLYAHKNGTSFRNKVIFLEAAYAYISVIICVLRW